MSALEYPPHITIGVYDDIDTDMLCAAFDSASAGMSRITVRFERLGYFVTAQAVILWAAPTLPRQAHRLHDRVHALIGADLCRPNYRPGAWVPHCSLATAIDLSRKPEALELANRPIKPFDVVFDVADCASFVPVEVIRERKLQAVSDTNGRHTSNDV